MCSTPTRFMTILFQSFLQEAPLSNSGMGKDINSLMLSIQHFFLLQPQRRPTSKATWKMVLERLPWRVTCSNYASFRLLTVARGGSCGSTRVYRGSLCAHKAEMYDYLLRRYRSVQNLGTSGRTVSVVCDVDHMPILTTCGGPMVN